MLRANQVMLKASASLSHRGTRVARFSTSQSLIPQRNLWDTIYSGTKGMISLLVSEESRQKFMDVVQGSTINADVLKQARFGSMLTIALFHDLQDPLFEKYSFNASDFLTGVKPALTNFHETIGKLQNEFPDVTSKEEQTEKLLQRMLLHTTTNEIKDVKTPWSEQAEKDPESPAAQLTAMVSPSLFNALFLATETEAMMAKHKEASTQVSYVALLSARAMVMDEEEYATTPNNAIENKKPEETPSAATSEKQQAEAQQKERKSDTVGIKMEASALPDTSSTEKKESDSAESKTDEEEVVVASEPDTTAVAAQIEVLYEFNHTVEMKPNLFAIQGEGQEEESKAPPKSEREETQIWVGTFEGWLNGGPEGSLRWRLTNWRPPTAEFPGLYHGFRSL